MIDENKLIKERPKWLKPKERGEALGFPQLGARPFWNDFIQYCEREFENIFQEELKKII